MKDSFREELREYLDFLDHYDYDDDEINKRTDDILKLIEKRIDSTNEQKENHNYSGEEEFIDGFSLGFDFAIEKVKEMLRNER